MDERWDESMSEDEAYELLKYYEELLTRDCDFTKVEHCSDIHGSYVKLIAVKRYE